MVTWSLVALGVLGFVFPTRHPEGDQLARRTEAVAAAVAARLNIQTIDPTPTVDLSQRLEKAHDLFWSGALGEAAVELDAVLDEGAKSPHRLAHSAAFVTAHIERAALALARGEAGRAQELLARVLRYDPSATLAEGEGSPPVRNAFDKVRGELGARPAIKPYDLGDACQSGIDLVIVGRALSAREVEYTRFDACRATAQAVVRDGNDREALGALSAIPVRAEQATTGRPEPAGGRATRIAGVITASAGAALLGVGGYFAVTASRRSDDAFAGCTMAMPCSADDLRARDAALDSAAWKAQLFLATGAAAVVTGAVLYYVGWRRQQWIAPSSHGVAVGWSFQ